MKTSTSRTAAFSLVEVAIAIAITSFCLIALLGLLPVGLKTNEASIEQTAANGILSEIAADLRATPSTVPFGAATTSQQFSIPIPANPVNTSPPSTKLLFNSVGQISTDSTAMGPWTYLVTITYLPNALAAPYKLVNGERATTATYVELQVSWPASVAVANALGSVQMFIALDRN